MIYHREIFEIFTRHYSMPQEQKRYNKAQIRRDYSHIHIFSLFPFESPSPLYSNGIQRSLVRLFRRVGRSGGCATVAVAVADIAIDIVCSRLLCL